MNFLQSIAKKKLVAPILVNGAGVTTTSVDVSGYGAARIIVDFGLDDAGLSALKVQHSDDDGSVDPYTTITGLDFWR